MADQRDASKHRFGFVRLTAVAPDIPHTSNHFNRNAALNTMVLEDQRKRAPSRNDLGVLEAMASFQQRVPDQERPDQGPLDARLGIVPPLTTDRRQGEVVTVRRSSVYDLMGAKAGRPSRPLGAYGPVGDAFPGFLDGVLEMVSRRPALTEPAPRNGGAITDLDVRPDPADPCVLLVSAFPSNAEFLLAYAPSDGGKGGFRRFTGETRLEGLMPVEYTILVGSETAAGDFKMDLRYSIKRAQGAPAALRCGTSDYPRSSNPVPFFKPVKRPTK